MPHGRISVPVYSALGSILDPTGPGVTFNQIDDVVVPVQDLSRVMQRSQVQHLVYYKNQALTADSGAALQWADISDWTEVAGDNIPITTDAELPPADGSVDRLLISIALYISANVAEWDSSVVGRVPALASSQRAYAWSALKANRIGGNIIPTGPNLLPFVLAPGEATVELLTDITFSAGVTLDWVLEMMVAPQGVMASYPGI
jgi:hypothetical protein